MLGKRICTAFFVLCFSHLCIECEGQLGFASYYGDNMVLQRGPKRAQIWGYADIPDMGKTVTLEVNDTASSYRKTYSSNVNRGPFSNKGVWIVLLDALTNKGPYNVTVSLETQKVTIKNVLFGDVWICSGQSNMAFTVDMMLNATAELQHASRFPEVRVFTANRVQSSVPLYDLQSVMQPWSLPSSQTLGQRRQYFSALCWMYGKLIHKDLGYPIGLIASSWGGTPVEAWMSPDALRRCSSQKKGQVSPDLGPMPFGPSTPSVLYNAMIQPFVNMTMYGAIWYQGEWNRRNPTTYNCTFPTMIDTWREVFNQGSQTQTGTFPFGFAQLAPNRNDDSVTTGFPDIRWAQTANVGYVPNNRMRDVFMAVAMDLPDFGSPFGSVHPRDKTTIGHRLSAGGLTVGYGRRHKHQGPWPTGYQLFDFNYTLVIEFDNGNTPIQVKSNNGFEVCCSVDGVQGCPPNAWVAAPIASSFTTRIHLNWIACANMFITSVRYGWRESPCPYKACAVYSVEKELPAPPFVATGPFNSLSPFAAVSGHRLYRPCLLTIIVAVFAAFVSYSPM